VAAVLDRNLQLLPESTLTRRGKSEYFWFMIVTDDFALAGDVRARAL
jgi:hypothetical protein